MDRFTVVGVLGFCCEPYWDSRNQRPSVALGKILSPLSSYSSSHHLEVCFVHTSGWCFYMQCWSLLIKLPDVFISSRVTNYITNTPLMFLFMSASMPACAAMCTLCSTCLTCVREAGCDMRLAIMHLASCPLLPLLELLLVVSGLP